MPDFNPAESLIRNAYETTEGLATEANWHYHDFVSETLANDAGVIEDPSITAAGEEPESLPSKLSTAGTIAVAWNAEGHAHYLANLIGQSATPTNPTAGVYVHKLAVGETDVAIPDTMTVEVSRDDGLPQLFLGARVAKASFALQPSSLLTGSIDLIAIRSHYWKAASQTAGTSTDPILRNFPNATKWAAADHDVYLKCTDGATKAFKAKVGSAAAYGGAGTVMTFTAATWIPLIDETGARIGDRALEVEAYFPDFSGLATNDEWKFDSERAVWVPSIPDVPKFNEIYAVIEIDSATIRLEQISLDILRPTQAVMNIGGRFADAVMHRGRRSASGSIQRDQLDVTLRKKLERGTPFSLRLEAYTGLAIGATAYEHSLAIVAMNCVPSGKTVTVANGQRLTEVIPFTCHPSSDVTYPNAVTLELTNSLANLTT